MPELGTYGSVRGALSNERPYRDHGVIAVGCFPAASSLTGLGLALAKESSHGAVSYGEKRSPD